VDRRSWAPHVERSAAKGVARRGRAACATFSIAARDTATGMLGVAVSSKALAVGAICPFVRARVGAVATQAWVNPFLGPRILDLLEAGKSAEEALRRALAGERYPAYRQLNVVDAQGRSATFTGAKTDPWCGGCHGDGYAIAGNILVSEDTVAAMEASFLASPAGADLAARLIGALEAGQAAGGDARGRQSAAVIVANRTLMPYIDLRVDDHPDPVVELRRIYDGARGRPGRGLAGVLPGAVGGRVRGRTPRGLRGLKPPRTEPARGPDPPGRPVLLVHSSSARGSAAVLPSAASRIIPVDTNICSL